MRYAHTDFRRFEIGRKIPGKQDLLRKCQVVPKLGHSNTNYSYSLIMFLSAAKDIKGLRKLIEVSGKIITITAEALM